MDSENNQSHVVSNILLAVLIIVLVTFGAFVASLTFSVYHNLEGIGTPTRSHQFISTVSLDNRTVWFCPVTDSGPYLCGNYNLASDVQMLPSVHWHNETNVIVDAYWDGTYYYDNETHSGPWKTLVGIYGNKSQWLLDSWVYATLLNGVVVKLEAG